MWNDDDSTIAMSPAELVRQSSTRYSDSLGEAHPAHAYSVC